MLGLLAERRGQDDDGADPRDAARPRRRPRHGRQSRRPSGRTVRAQADRPLRPVRGGRREPDRAREPLDVRPPLPAPERRGASPCRRAPRAVRARRRGGPGGEDVLGGMRRRLDLAGALVGRPPVPRRADHRPRSAQPPGHVGRDPRAGPRRTTLLLTTQYLEEADELAHEIAVVDHGRIIGQARQTSSRHGSAASGSRSSRSAPTSLTRSSSSRPTEAACPTSTRGGSRSRRRRCSSSSTSSAVSATRRSRSTTSACAGRPSTTCLTLTGHAAEQENAEEEQRQFDAERAA